MQGAFTQGIFLLDSVASLVDCRTQVLGAAHCHSHTTQLLVVIVPWPLQVQQAEVENHSSLEVEIVVEGTLRSLPVSVRARIYTERVSYIIVGVRSLYACGPS